LSEEQPSALAAELHELLQSAGATLAVAESLTGGLLGAVLTSVPGASASFLGGITAYATPAKASLVGVDEALLSRHGAVHPEVAAAMARGARERFASTYAVALTGVAGPDPQDGQLPGTVHLALQGEGVEQVRSVLLTGDRWAVRAGAVRAALELVIDHLASSGKSVG
jgi:nicotinamide-nucleotide amidase